MPALEQPEWLLWWPAALPRTGRLLLPCPELIPQGREMLSLTMKPKNLSPLHTRFSWCLPPVNLQG